MIKNNLFQNVPDKLPDEIFETIAQSENVKIERIVSDGHTSQPGFWYNQDQNEFVIVLKGNAVLEFEDGTTKKMSEGDYQIIPAHQKHRVAYTDTIGKTIWLVVFYSLS